MNQAYLTIGDFHNFESAGKFGWRPRWFSGNNVSMKLDGNSFSWIGQMPENYIRTFSNMKFALDFCFSLELNVFKNSIEAKK